MSNTYRNSKSFLGTGWAFPPTFHDDKLTGVEMVSQVEDIKYMISYKDSIVSVCCDRYHKSGRTELVINKILCGLDFRAPLNKAEDLTSDEKELVDSLLKAVTQQWKPLNAPSIDTLRQSFFQREGKLMEEDGQFFLKIERKPFDMLLDQIPWNISKIKLSWMQKIQEVEWNT